MSAVPRAFIRIPPAAWLTAAAATLAVGASLVLSVNAYLALVALLLLAAVGVIAFVTQFDRPVLGLLVLVGLGIAFPFEFRGPAGVMVSSSFPLAAFLCAVWLARVVFTPGRVLDRSRAVYSVAAFMGITLLAFAMGQFPWFPSSGAPLPAQTAELGLFILSGLLFLAAGHQIETLDQLKWLTLVLIAAGAFACVVQTVPGLTVIGRVTTRPGSVGSLFWTWLVAVCFAQAVLNRDLSVLSRLALLAITALVLYHGLVQVRSWASGWVPPLAAIGVILLCWVPRFSIGFGLIAAPAALLLGGDVVRSILVEESYSLMTRQEAWASLWQLVEKSPLLGTGLANYYYYTENMPILGWYVRFISHNNYQDLLVQTGFLGLLGFCWVAFEAFLLALKLYWRLPSGFPRAYAAGALGGLAGSLLAGMLGDWIIPFYYNGGILGFRSSLLFWVFLGGVLALKRILEARLDVRAVTSPPVPDARAGRLRLRHAS